MTKHIKVQVLLVFSLIFFILITGCNKLTNELENIKNQTEDNEKGLGKNQVLRMGFNSMPPQLLPQTARDNVSFDLLNAIFEGLVRLNSNGTVGPGIAKKWEIDETKTVYTFELRDAQWSDGTYVTAYDFKESWLKVLDPKTESQYSYLLFNIKNAQKYNESQGVSSEEVGIDVIDKHTLQVTLEKPSDYFIDLISFVTFFPIKDGDIEQYVDTYFEAPENIISNGPFKIKKWEKDGNIILEKNHMYWDEKNVVLDNIEITVIEDTNTAVNLYKKGKLDVIEVPSEYINIYKDTQEFGNMITGNTYYLQFNNEDIFFKNKKIRMALALAIDRKSLTENILADGSIPAYGIVPYGINGKYNTHFRNENGKLFDDINDENIDKHTLMKLLDEGLKELNKTKEDLEQHIAYIIGNSDRHKKLGKGLQQMWMDNLDLNVKIESLELSERLKRYDEKRYTFGIAGWGADYNDPETFLNIFITGVGNNDSYWSNSKYDELMNKAANSFGEERFNYMLQAEKLMIEEMPVSPLFFESRNFLQKSYVQRLIRYPVGVDNEYKWVNILTH